MTYIVWYRDASRQPDIVQDFDGGGAFVGEDFEGYEVHGIKTNGEFFCEFQKSIAKVIEEDTGLDFEHFGNPYYPGHPYRQETL